MYENIESHVLKGLNWECVGKCFIIISLDDGYGKGVSTLGCLVKILKSASFFQKKFLKKILKSATFFQKKSCKKKGKLLIRTAVKNSVFNLQTENQCGLRFALNFRFRLDSKIKKRKRN